MNYGYARVSSRDQNEARQIVALTDAGICRENIFLDKQSGKDFNREHYHVLMEELHAGDVLFVKSIDRLGRNFEEILDQWSYITRTLQVHVVVLDMPLLDTRQHLDLTGVLISNIVLQLFSYVAEIERNFIRQRQSEGIAAAKKRGVQFGRKRLPLPSNYKAALGEYRSGKLSVSQAAELCGMARSTFYYYAKSCKGGALRPN